MSETSAQDRETPRSGAAVVTELRSMMNAVGGRYSKLQMGPFFKPYGRELREHLTTFRNSARAKGAEVETTDNEFLTIVVVTVENRRHQES